MTHNQIYDQALKKYQEKNYDQSIQLLNLILEQNDAHYHSWHLLGNIFFNLNDLDSAKDFFLAAINKKSDFFDAYYMLGNVLFKADLFEDAINIWMEGSQYKPYFALIFANIAIAYDRLGKKDQAIFYAQKTLTLDKNCVEAIFCLAKIYQANQDLKNTQSYLKKVLKLQPTNVLAHFDLSYVELALGNYEKGFKEFEYRKKMINREKEYNYLPFKLYQGESLQDKHLLLYHEQGFGDTIQFIRFILELTCKKITIGIQNPLHKLFAYNFPHIEFLSEIKDSMPFDCMEALMSSALMAQIHTINGQKYLNVEEKDIQNFKKHHLNSEQLNVGLVWKASTANTQSDIKSLRLKELEILLKKENCQFFSLQIENFEEALNTPIHLIGQEFKNFYDTAVALKSLDLFIGVDTAVSHLAGALGVKCYLIYESNTIDFRWANENKKSIWYESVEVFSKEEIKKINQNLDNLIKEKLNDL
jgi:Tfp pilus assembly protein PilF